MRILSTGNVGINETAPDTILHVTSTNPYLTLENSSTEDGDTGRESQIRFQGRQSGGEVSILAKIQGSHDGTGDDEKGDMIFYTNDGNDGASTTERMRIDSSGNIGIGTNAPSAQLHVDGTGAGGDGTLFIERASAGYGLKITAAESTSDTTIETVGDGTGNAELIFGTQETGSMKIDSNQNVLFTAASQKISRSAS